MGTELVSGLHQPMVTKGKCMLRHPVAARALRESCAGNSAAVPQGGSLCRELGEQVRRRGTGKEPTAQNEPRCRRAANNGDGGNTNMSIPWEAPEEGAASASLAAIRAGKDITAHTSHGIQTSCCPVHHSTSLGPLPLLSQQPWCAQVGSWAQHDLPGVLMTN